MRVHPAPAPLSRPARSACPQRSAAHPRPPQAGPPGLAQPKFAPFVPQSRALVALQQFCYEAPTREAGAAFQAGLLRRGDILSVADLLVEGFADSLGYKNTFRRFFHQRILQYLNKHIGLLPKTVILVGAVGPAPAAAAGEDPVADGSEAPPPPEAQSRPGGTAEGATDRGPQETVVGAVEVSFSPKTRIQPLFSKAPPDSPYVCNLAVGCEHRRRGYGSQLMAAAEEVVRLRGFDEVYLHLRCVDTPAQALYRKSGYQVAHQDSWLVQLLFQDRTYLMRKRLG